MPRSLMISIEGQITVPIETRKRLGVKPGDRVEFVETRVRPSYARLNQTRTHSLSSPAASRPFGNMEEINAWVHEMRGHDPETP